MCGSSWGAARGALGVESRVIPVSLAPAVAAGVLGLKRTVMTLVGDTLNTASRMESNSLPSHVQATEDVWLNFPEQYQELFTRWGGAGAGRGQRGGGGCSCEMPGRGKGEAGASVTATGGTRCN